MAKVLKPAYPPTKFRCPCGAVIQFDVADIAEGDVDTGESDWVLCPCCNRSIPAFIVWPSWSEGSNRGKA
jgi:hypothetical protein